MSKRMRLITLALVAFLPVAAMAAGVQAVLSPAGQAFIYWRAMNLPRAFAVGPKGAFGWAAGADTPESMRAQALRDCEAMAKPCEIVADGLQLPNLPAPPPPPGPLISTWNYSFVPDSRFIWHGPGKAVGVYVWAHGNSGPGTDLTGQQPQAHVRLLNNAGYDVVRFDRQPTADTSDRAAGWLRDGLATLRQRGYRKVVVGGQSRGAWNALQMLDTPGLADAVVAISPAAQGSGGSPNLLSQTDDLRALLADAGVSATRVVMVQFDQDLFIGDPDRRVALFQQTLPRLGGLLLIDRPPGFKGHLAGEFFLFNQQYGPCIAKFVLGEARGCDPDPPIAATPFESDPRGAHG